MKERKIEMVERMVLNEYDAIDEKIIDARLMWFVYQNMIFHENPNLKKPLDEMEQHFLLLDLGEVAYDDPFYPTISLAQTKKIIEILQGYVDYYEEYKKEREMQEDDK